MWAVCKREIQSFFYSPIGYVFLAIFMLISAIIFFNVNIMVDKSYADYSTALQNMTIYLSFITPILTMRSFAEERRNKTDQLLLTSPLSVREIVLGKYFAALFVLLAAMVLNLIFPIVIALYNSSFSGIMLVSGYVGFFLIGACFMAVGIFISSLTESQIVAAISSFAVAFALWLGNSLLSDLGSDFLNTAASSLNMLQRYNSFAEGMIGVAPFIYYISVSGLFMFLTVRSVERRRWMGV